MVFVTNVRVVQRTGSGWAGFVEHMVEGSYIFIRPTGSDNIGATGVVNVCREVAAASAT